MDTYTVVITESREHTFIVHAVSAGDAIAETWEKKFKRTDGFDAKLSKVIEPALTKEQAGR